MKGKTQSVPFVVLHDVVSLEVIVVVEIVVVGTVVLSAIVSPSNGHTSFKQ